MVWLPYQARTPGRRVSRFSSASPFIPPPSDDEPAGAGRTRSCLPAVLVEAASVRLDDRRRVGVGTPGDSPESVATTDAPLVLLGLLVVGLFVAGLVLGMMLSS